MTHQVDVTGGQQLYDSEGLRVVGLSTKFTTKCNDCDYSVVSETVDQALELKYKHEAANG